MNEEGKRVKKSDTSDGDTIISSDCESGSCLECSTDDQTEQDIIIEDGIEYKDDKKRDENVDKMIIKGNIFSGDCNNDINDIDNSDINNKEVNSINNNSINDINNKEVNNNNITDIDRLTSLQQTVEPFQNNHNTIYVGNLPPSITEERLRELFMSCGSIKSVILRRWRVMSGFVEFMRKKSVGHAMKMSGSVVGVRRIVVRKKK